MGRGLQAAPGLVCFDLDGTLYHDDRIYLRMIDYYFAGTPWEKEIGSVKAEMSRVLAGGNPAFRCGRFAPKEWGVCPGPAAALLAVSSPMEAIYGEWTERKSSDLDPMLDCISNRAYAALQAQRELPVYRYPGGYAHEHGELEQYRASRKADIACKEAIESAITEHYRDNCLGREAVSQVVEQFGYERVLHVLANTVRHKEWDGRISQGNKAWARTVPVFEDLDAWGNDRNKEFVVDRSHPGIIDLFVDMVRHEYLLTQPLTKDDIRAEAARILSAFQAARGPNSPSGTHFMVQVSPDFLARANSKNQNRLVSMLPFRSLSISTLEGRKGVYALITKDEDRAQSLRLRKPSVRKKLSETKAEPGHTDKKKVREQER